MAKSMSHSDFISKIRDVLPSITAVDIYQNCRTKILVRCDVCGYQWLARSSDLLRGHGCPRCSGKERKTPARFREEVALINPNLEVIED